MGDLMRAPKKACCRRWLRVSTQKLIKISLGPIKHFPNCELKYFSGEDMSKVIIEGKAVGFCRNL